MTHPYRYSLIDMNTALRPRMNQFICWNMENEHGDLNLGLLEEKEMPLSKLGLQLQERESSNAARAIVDRIKQNADGNVAMAKLRLDILHGLNDVDLIDSQTGITPSGVIEFLELALNSTQHKSMPQSQRRLALKAMAIVSKFHYLMGVSFNTISYVISLSETGEDDADRLEVLSMGDIALSTQGLLLFGINRWKPLDAYNIEKPLYAYSQTFHTYLMEDNQVVKEMASWLGLILERLGQSWESLAESEERQGEIEEDMV